MPTPEDHRLNQTDRGARQTACDRGMDGWMGSALRAWWRDAVCVFVPRCRSLSSPASTVRLTEVVPPQDRPTPTVSLSWLRPLPLCMFVRSHTRLARTMRVIHSVKHQRTCARTYAPTVASPSHRSLTKPRSADTRAVHSTYNQSSPLASQPINQINRLSNQSLIYVILLPESTCVTSLASLIAP